MDYFDYFSVKILEHPQFYQSNEFSEKLINTVVHAFCKLTLMLIKIKTY